MLTIIGIVLSVVFALGATSPFWLPWLLQKFADRNFLITSIEEGTAKAFMRFGEFNRFAMAYRKHHFSNNWDVIEEGNVEAESSNGKKASMHFMDEILPGGLRWIGLPFANTVYEYHFQWTSIRQGSLGESVQTSRGIQAIVEQKKLEDLLVSRDEKPDYVELKRDVYGITIKDTEVKDLFPISAIALLTGKIVNPYKALFRTEQWLEQVTNFLRPYLKEYIGGHTFIQLVTVSKTHAKGALTARGESEAILSSPAPNSRTVVQYIREEWGFDIEHLNLVNFETVGKLGEAFQNAAATKYLKHQEAEGIREIADAEAYRVQKVTIALKEGGDNAMIVRTLEAYEKMGELGNVTTIIGNQPISMLVNSASKKGEEKK